MAPFINGSTQLMAMIGDPIAQVRTPEAINPIFRALERNIVCVPVHLAADDFAAAWTGLKASRNLIGMGITVPHKQAAAGLCDSLDPLAAMLGAANVVRRERDGSLRGYQFDGEGFVRGLIAQGIAPRGRDCLLIGAGGAAIAIASALLTHGVSRVTVTNRSRHKADTLVDLVSRAFGAGRIFAGQIALVPGQLIINATSLGLQESDPLPLDPALIDSTMTVAEVVAKPDLTALLLAAQARGARIHKGIHMIEGQVGLIAEHLGELWGR